MFDYCKGLDLKTYLILILHEQFYTCAMLRFRLLNQTFFFIFTHSNFLAINSR